MVKSKKTKSKASKRPAAKKEKKSSQTGNRKPASKTHKTRLKNESQPPLEGVVGRGQCEAHSRTYDDEQKAISRLWSVLLVAESDLVVIEGVQYVKKRKLGTGGSGSVYEVIKEGDGTRYALKEVTLRQNASIFKGEVERLQTLKNCPHIIDLIAHDFTANDTIMRMVLELGDRDLEAEVKKSNGKFDAATVRAYAHEIGKGIQEMHDHVNKKGGYLGIWSGRVPNDIWTEAVRQFLQ
ncbi:hypothetical protein TELCIR_16653 [Teladorsagia circumcincta]|uniref:Protein kinase domain-containing protein n=1 Tax=Teladorsagia circumcincta TaxID=45464 RepID=A0A2G9TX28_TELCI|nr:hypothetical protein TELCIR_16653 [Teladorsagia circumcincta]